MLQQSREIQRLLSSVRQPLYPETAGALLIDSKEDVTESRSTPSENSSNLRHRHRRLIAASRAAEPDDTHFSQGSCVAAALPHHVSTNGIHGTLQPQREDLNGAAGRDAAAAVAQASAWLTSPSQRDTVTGDETSSPSYHVSRATGASALRPSPPAAGSGCSARLGVGALRGRIAADALERRRALADNSVERPLQGAKGAQRGVGVAELLAQTRANSGSTSENVSAKEDGDIRPPEGENQTQTCAAEYDADWSISADRADRAAADRAAAQASGRATRRTGSGAVDKSMAAVKACREAQVTEGLVTRDGQLASPGGDGGAALGGRSGLTAAGKHETEGERRPCDSVKTGPDRVRHTYIRPGCGPVRPESESLAATSRARPDEQVEY